MDKNGREIVNKYVLSQVKSGSMSKELAFTILKETNKEVKSEKEDIAVIGIACRFPLANNTEEYWELLKNGTNCIREFPESRRKDTDDKLRWMLERDGVFDENAYSLGGYIEEIDKFDASFFKVTPKDANSIEPAHRLFLEVAYEAFEDAGYNMEKLNATKTGVFVGMDNTYKYEYNSMHFESNLTTMTGSWTSLLPSRVSYLFNLKGPSVLIDTACSSGLVSVHNACKSIQAKESTMALAGGVNIIFANIVNFENIQSYDGKIKTFDKSSKGIVWGEGVGAILLKPLSEAVKDRDNIYAVIKGSSINNDGNTSGITAPNAETQTEVIVKAWKDADIEPETISYIEAHGTGTVLGDPIEIKGIKNAFEQFTLKKQFCGIGSVKTNLGHLVGASGLASAIKVILALKNKEMPASINFEEPNPYINFCDSPVYINDKLTKWKTEDYPRRAGVSSFGFSRTNCHIIFEEYLSPADNANEEVSSDKCSIITMSAKTAESLIELIQKYKAYLEADKNISILDICYTANAGRSHYNNRVAMSVKNVEDLKNKIEMLCHMGLVSMPEQNIYCRLAGENGEGSGQDWLKGKTKKELGIIVDEKIGKLTQVEEYAYESIMCQICQLYVQGADISWKELYKNSNYKKINLPTYAFQRKRHWIENQYTEKKSGIKKKEVEANPQFTKLLTKTFREEIYITNIGINNQRELKKYNIMGKNILADSAIFEILREACTNRSSFEDLEFRNIDFTSILHLDDINEKVIHTILKKANNGIRFSIAAIDALKTDEDEGWVLHSQGEMARVHEVEVQNDIPLEDIIKICCKEPVQIIPGREGNIELEDQWNCVKKVLTDGSQNYLIELELPKGMQEMDKYIINPVLLDNGLNAALYYIEDKDIYLPKTCKRAKFYTRLPEKLYSYIKRIDDGNDPENISFDISLLSMEGKRIALFEGYSVERVSIAKEKYSLLYGVDNLFHKLMWKQLDLQEKEERSNYDCHIVVKDKFGFADRLIERLRTEEAKIIVIEEGEGYSAIKDDYYRISFTQDNFMAILSQTPAISRLAVIYLASICGDREVGSSEELLENLDKGIYSFFDLVKSIYRSKPIEAIDIFAISDYGYEVTGGEEALHPRNAAIIGLGRVAGKEHPGVKCRCIDIDLHTPVEKIVSEIQSQSTSQVVAYRNGKRYTEELECIKLESFKEAPVHIVENGVYIITGGTGSIGLEICKFLACKNKIKLALLNRSQIAQRENWEEILRKAEDIKQCGQISAIKELEAAGSKVLLYSVDITQEEDLKRVLEEIRQKHGEIRGIFHCAGIAGEGYITKKSKKAFQEVTGPKTIGTYLLDKLTENDPVEIFAMMSSVITPFGNPTQADYTAANSYMDTYAPYRSRKGRRTLTINWTAWKEKGMAVDQGLTKNNMLFDPVSTLHAVAALEELLKKDVKRAFIFNFNYKHELIRNLEKFPLNLSEQLKDRIETEFNKVSKESSIAEENKASQQIAVSLNNRDELGLETDYEAPSSDIEEKLCCIWQRVLGIDKVGVVDNFFELGGQSLLAMQVVTQLEDYQLNYEAIFQYPTIKELAVHILELKPASLKEVKVADAPVNVASSMNINNYNIIEAPEKYKIQNIEAFNEVLYKSCYYNAFFPVLRYYNKDINLILSNDISIYNYNSSKKGMPLEVEYMQMKSEPQLLNDSGLGVVSKTNVDLQSSVIGAISNCRPVIVFIDTYFESSRKDTYKKLHWPHTLLIYGYNMEKRSFTIMEHDDINSLNYCEKLISFEEINEAYEGYLENFQMSINNSSYYEFSAIDRQPDNEVQGSKAIEYTKVFMKNMLLNREVILLRLEHIKILMQYWSEKVADENYVSKYTEEIIFGINNIIKAKNAELFKIKRLLDGQSLPIEKEISELLELWIILKSIFEKYKITKVYKKNIFEGLRDRLGSIYLKEISYLDKLYDALQIPLE